MPTATEFLTLSTPDVDLAIAIGSKIFYRHRVAPTHPTSSFLAEFTAANIGTIRAGVLRYGCEVTGFGGGIDGGFGVHLPLDGRLDLQVAGEDIAATPDTAAIVSLVEETRFHGWTDGGEQLLTMKFEQGSLETELRRMLGPDLTRPLVFLPHFDVRSGPAAQWAHLARSVAASLDSPDSLTWNPLMSAHLSSAIMTGLLLSADHNFRDDLEAKSRPLPPAALRRAMTFIENHAHEPITVPMIASATGFSVRSLQRAFTEHLETSPTAYLARVRLDHVHRALVEGAPETTSVSKIASQWGFSHLSRFAASYRLQYGVSPSVTLRS